MKCIPVVLLDQEKKLFCLIKMHLAQKQFLLSSSVSVFGCAHSCCQCQTICHKATLTHTGPPTVF